MVTLLAACDRSGLPQRTFARQHGITPGAFAWWRHTLRAARPRGRRRTAAFVEVTPAAPPLARPAAAGAGFVVRLPRGTVLRVPPHFDGAALEALLGVLTRAC